MKFDRLKQIEDLLADAYEYQTQYDSMLLVETDPFEQNKLENKLKALKQNIERLEQEHLELENKHAAAEAVIAAAQLVNPTVAASASAALEQAMLPIPDAPRLVDQPAPSEPGPAIVPEAPTVSGSTIVPEAPTVTALPPRLPLRARAAQSTATPLQRHCDKVISWFKQGRVVPVLGTDVNLAGRPAGLQWQPDGQYLPGQSELVSHLTQNFGYPDDAPLGLASVAQYATVMNGSPAPLYDELRNVLGYDYTPTPVHQFLAQLPATLRRLPDVPKEFYPIIVTAGYDSTLERAFELVGEPYDMVRYLADGDDRDFFQHFSHDSQTYLKIERPNEYGDLPLYERPVILRMNGAFDLFDPENDSFVIAEDNYINYLTRTEISRLVPTTLIEKLRRSYLLFLGYNLRDWSLRVLINRVWGQEKLDFPSWLVSTNPAEIDLKFSQERNIEIIQVPLDEYMETLNSRFQAALQ